MFIPKPTRRAKTFFRPTRGRNDIGGDALVAELGGSILARLNLVAKEYVAAQNADDPGVLILSRFAGAAIEFGRALLVNPYDAESVAGAIAQALAMPLEERRARHHALLATISEYDVDWWQREFLAALRGDDGVRQEFPVPAAPMRPRRGRLGSAYPDTAAVHWNPAVKVQADQRLVSAPAPGARRNGGM
jgi:hypothetical protein